MSYQPREETTLLHTLGTAIVQESHGSITYVEAVAVLVYLLAAIQTSGDLPREFQSYFGWDSKAS